MLAAVARRDRDDDSDRRRRRHGEPRGWVVAVLAMATTAVTFAPWGRSGTAVRSSYELVDVTHRAAVLPDGVAAVAPTWFLVPALCGVVLLGVAANHRVTAGAGAATLGALVGTGAVLVARSPLVAETAADVAIVLGACTTVGGLVLLATSGRRTAR